MNKINALMVIAPTCSGKEKLSLKIAEHLNTDIISMDSMKIYKGMDIGTSKPSQLAQKKCKHHLIDFLEPNQEYNVNQYLADAKEICINKTQNKQTILFSGGTSLYAKGLFSGMFDLPSVPSEIRSKLDQEYDLNQEIVYDKLLSIDPQTCKKVFPNDKKRVIRALEVYEHTGKPISYFQTQFEKQESEYNIYAIGLRWDRSEMHARIEKRVHWMIEAGLFQEIIELKNKYPEFSKSASRAVGYKEILAHLKGELTKEEAIERIIINTRQLCKHQTTWMRKFSINWIDMNSDISEQQQLQQALDLINNRFENANE
ncbi:MAG: tRNA (adenosine(37)-N6)-dimethylallyltransferase MiaA [Planctomycetota bacterium]|nr:MAG: tRNA (adenosine(37)-N6)-dimethylallyltransferase MiaA [Planctomycetota bacterium]